MKAKQICKEHNLDSREFTDWIKGSSYTSTSSVMGGVDVTDGQDIDEIVAAFRRYAEQKQAEKEQAAKEAQRAAQEASQAAERREAAIAALPVTSGFNYEGHSITRYAGYVSGDAVVEVGRSASNGTEHMARLAAMRVKALARMKEAAHELGCNAVIGLDFDYPQVDQEQGAMGTGKTTYLPYLFGVVANGTAVVIEEAAPR